MPRKEVKYVWSWPIRLTHWFTFFSISILTITGYYIAFPPDFIAPRGEPFENFFMANLRLIHFLAAIVMMICFLTATYLIFFYRFHDLWKDIRPTGSNLKQAWKSIKYYFGFSKHHRHYDYMDPMALLSVSTYTILSLITIFTGIALYVAPRTTTGIFASLMHFLSVWTLYLFGNLQGVRTAHHLCMWLILGWAFIHVYFQVWKSVRLKQYDISAIVGGYKFIDAGK
ncbi:MAG: Ni/Fe-hydrogenase, b-type cytochrome subunit [Fidelibacterota bacterium]